MKTPAFVLAAVLLLAAAAYAQAPKPAAPEPGWITASNKPCKIWNPAPQPDESVTWSGGCDNGYASGQGVLKWTENGKPDMEFEGMYDHGKRNGPGVVITPDGQRLQGMWIDDEPVPFRANTI